MHELKLDGFRMGVLIDGADVRIISRRGTDYTAAYPEVAKAARSLGVESAVIDGEVVVLDERGISSFQRLQQVASNRRGLTFFAFDLLELNGASIVRLPLEERKRALEHLLADNANDVIRYCQHFDADGADVFAKACALGAEGIVSKRRDAPYQSGARSADWQKTKCLTGQEFVVGGFTDSERSSAEIGSLLIGYYEGDALRFAGKVGTGRGWSASFGRELRRTLEAIEIDQPAFDPRPPGWLGQNAHWVTPTLVAQVDFAEWTEGGHVRHPTLRGFRDDKKPTDVVREGGDVIVAATPSKRRPARVVFPRIQKTTDDLVALYTDIAERALPHLARRPLTLVRMRQPITAPDALRTQAAFVRHTERDQRFVPASVGRVRIEEKEKVGEYCYINSLADIVALIEAGAIEWHTWNATVDEVELPDRMVFDIDPGDGVSWKDVVASARHLKTQLARLGLESWPKTTGGKGLHVVVPFEREPSWDDVFAFSRAFAGHIANEDSDRYTLSFDRDARAGKVLIDYKRNYRTSIAVAAFSMRARPNGAMSVPVSWAELSRINASDQWTVDNVRARLERQRKDPWAAYWTTTQRLPRLA